MAQHKVIDRLAAAQKKSAAAVAEKAKAAAEAAAEAARKQQNKAQNAASAASVPTARQNQSRGSYYSPRQYGADSAPLNARAEAARKAMEEQARALEQSRRAMEELYRQAREARESYHSLKGQFVGENAGQYEQKLLDQYTEATELYVEGKAEYDRVYGAYKPYEDAYNRAARELNDYLAAEEREYQAWRGTIRDAQSIRAEQQELQQKRAELKRLMQMTQMPTGGYGAISQATGPAQNELRIRELQAYLGEQGEREKLLQEELDWSEHFRFEDLRQNPDFGEKSRFTGVNNLGDRVYQYVNGNPNAGAGTIDALLDRGTQDDVFMQIVGGNDGWRDIIGYNETPTYLEYMTEDEKAMYNYVYSTQGREAAQGYLDHLKPELTARQTGTVTEFWRMMAGQNAVTGALYSGLSVPMSAAGGFQAGLGQVASALRGEELDPNASYNLMTNIKNDIRDEVSGKIQEHAGPVGSFAYGTVMSMGDMLMDATAGGPGAMALIGTRAFSESVMDAKGRGLSDDEALKMGAVSALAEVMTERIGLDEMLHLPKDWEDAGFWKGLARGAGGEAAEEGLTNIVNLAADLTIAGENSEFARSIAQYKAEGKDDAAALEAALKDAGISLGLDVLGGALSGGAFGGYRGYRGKRAGEAKAAAEKKTGAAEQRDGTEAVPYGEDSGGQQTPQSQSAGEPVETAPVAGTVSKMETVETVSAQNVREDVQKETAAPDNRTKAPDNGTVREGRTVGETVNENGGKANEEAGERLLPGGPERADAAGAGEQTGSYAEIRERKQTEARSQAEAAAQRRVKAENLEKRGHLQRVSAQDLGLRQGTEVQELLELPRIEWDQELYDTATRLEKETGMTVRTVTGNIGVRLKGGGVGLAKGYIDRVNKTIVLNVSHSQVTAGQIGDHELWHHKMEAVGRISGDRYQVTRLAAQRIQEEYSPEDFDEVLDAYIDGYGDVYDQSNWEEFLNRVYEEIMADAYAGINAFGVEASKFRSTVDSTMDELGMGRNMWNAAEQEDAPAPGGDQRVYADEDAPPMPEDEDYSQVPDDGEAEVYWRTPAGAPLSDFQVYPDYDLPDPKDYPGGVDADGNQYPGGYEAWLKDMKDKGLIVEEYDWGGWDDSMADFSMDGTYGGIREVIAKKGLDELSKRYGDHFPLSAMFDATMRADNTALVMETVQAHSVKRRQGESVFKTGKRAFAEQYGKKTTIRIKQMEVDAELFPSVAGESISKAIGRTDEQSTLDVIPHIGDILSNSILMGIERIAHTDNKGSAIYGYRLYNLYWYQDGNKKTPNCLVCTVVQDLDKAEGYVFQNIENVTVRHGLPGNNAGMPTPSGGNTYTVSQLYRTVKAVDRINGGLKYSDAERKKYLFDYTERNDGVRYSLDSVDSDGRELTLKQQRFFKDSKVRDEDGRLMVMYHGTSNGGHTVFDTYGKARYGLFGKGSYFTDNPGVAQTYTSKGRGDRKQVYNVYLNITNPMDMGAQSDASAWAAALPDVVFPQGGTNEDCYRAMERYFEDEGYTRWEAAEAAVETIESMGYDGITHIGGGRVKADGVRHRVYIAFYPEQVKDVGNRKPTNDPDIRFSLDGSLSREEYERLAAEVAGDQSKRNEEFVKSRLTPEQYKQYKAFAREDARAAQRMIDEEDVAERAVELALANKKITERILRKNFDLKGEELEELFEYLFDLGVIDEDGKTIITRELWDRIQRQIEDETEDEESDTGELPGDEAMEIALRDGRLDPGTLMMELGLPYGDALDLIDELMEMELLDEYRRVNVTEQEWEEIRNELSQDEEPEEEAEAGEDTAPMLTQEETGGRGVADDMGLPLDSRILTQENDQHIPDETDELMQEKPSIGDPPEEMVTPPKNRDWPRVSGRRTVDGETIDRAVIAIREAGRVSAVAIKMRLGISHESAKRIVDELERLGIVTPPDENGRRWMPQMQAAEEEVIREETREFTDEELRPKVDARNRREARFRKNMEREDLAALRARQAEDAAAGRRELAAEEKAARDEAREKAGTAREERKRKAQEKREKLRQEARERIRRAAENAPADSAPTIARKELQDKLISLFSVGEGQRGELRREIGRLADRMIAEGTVDEQDLRRLIDRLYESGVMVIEPEEVYAEGRNYLKDEHIYIKPEQIREWGDDWPTLRKKAWVLGVYLVTDRRYAGLDVWNAELASYLPGLFDENETDDRTILNRILQIAEEGKAEKVSLPEYTKRIAKQEHQSEEALLYNMERQVEEALRTFGEKASLEMRLKNRNARRRAMDREEAAIAREADRAELERKQQELADDREALRELNEAERDRLRLQRAENDRRNAAERRRLAEERAARRRKHQENVRKKELRELQEKTLKALQWISKNRRKAPEAMQEAFAAVLGNIDLYAISMADEMRWSSKYGATWKDLKQMYLHAQETDPNFVPSEDLDRIVRRLDSVQLESMDFDQLRDLYQAAVGLRTEFYNRNNVIGSEEHEIMGELYNACVEEMRTAPKKLKGMLDRFLNLENLTPMNVFEEMGGFNPDGALYKFAKQLEDGERKVRSFKVRSNKILADFLEDNADWIHRADGQGKDGIWIEVEIPQLIGMKVGEVPEFGGTVKVFMTPMQRVHLYLESRNYDNLRHMTGGRTFADRELYSQGKREEAFAKGTTIRMAPETVQLLVKDMSPEELELARLLDKYYNDLAATEINKVSNILLGYNKAMGGHYAPIFTNANYTKSEFGKFDGTAEGAGNLKERVKSKNPSYNISALEAFERNMDRTATYVGMAIPVRNWNTLMNWRTSNSSFADEITHSWGKGRLDYIQDLITDLQNPMGEQQDMVTEMSGKLLSNYISSAFGHNPGIVVKQLGSIPMASAYLDWKHFPKGVIGRGKIDRELIGRYTQELDWRTMGFSMPETKQLKDAPNWSQKNKAVGLVFGGDAITTMDGWAASVLWPWAENKVRAEFPGLEVGDAAMIESGQSPFYQKVAELFNDAVSRSQSVSDQMHQGRLRKSKHAAAKAVTMFRSDSAQSYNVLRQRLGELDYYRRQGEGGKEMAKAMKKTVGAAATAVLINGIWGTAVDLLVKALKGKLDEEDKEPLQIAEDFFWGVIDSYAGMVITGDILAETVGYWFTGEMRFDQEAPGVEQFNDILQAADKIINAGKKGNLIGAIKIGAETIATYGYGLPVKNVEAYLMGLFSWALPGAKVAYEDLLKAPAKADLKGLEGDALTVRLNHVLKGYGVELEPEVRDALAALYEAGYTEAVPSAAPDSVTVDGMELELDGRMKKEYDKTRGGIMEQELPEITGSAFFAQADEKTRKAMVTKLYNYAAEKAKEAVLEDYAIGTTAQAIDEIVRAGGSAADYAVFDAVTADMAAWQRAEVLQEWGTDEAVTGLMFKHLVSKSWEDEQAELRKVGVDVGQFLELYAMHGQIDSRDLKATEKATEFAYWLDGQRYTDKQKAAIKDQMAYFQMMPADASRYNAATAAGLDREQALELTEELDALEPPEGKTSVQEIQKYRVAIDQSVSESNQLKMLQSVGLKDASYDKVARGYELGVAPAAWVRVKEVQQQFDANGNGNMTGAEWEAAIEGICSYGIVLPGDNTRFNLTNEQKAVLWQMMVGKNTKAKNNPFSPEAGQRWRELMGYE